MGKKPKYSSFEEMPVWKLAYDFVLNVYDITKTYPKEERYGLTSDTRRAANSVPANIAEAFGRYHFKDKQKFYYNSRGSITEVLSHLKIGLGLGYLDDNDYSSAKGTAANIWEELNRIISSLGKPAP